MAVVEVGHFSTRARTYFTTFRQLNYCGPVNKMGYKHENMRVEISLYNPYSTVHMRTKKMSVWRNFSIVYNKTNKNKCMQSNFVAHQKNEGFIEKLRKQKKKKRGNYSIIIKNK